MDDWAMTPCWSPKQKEPCVKRGSRFVPRGCWMEQNPALMLLYSGLEMRHDWVRRLRLLCTLRQDATEGYLALLRRSEST